MSDGTNDQNLREPDLAAAGGRPAVTDPLPPMYPGGMRIGDAEEEAVLAVLRRKRLFRYYGPEEGPSVVAELESAFADHLGCAHTLGVSSGTAALTCSLAALGIGPGDEVIVPAYTWIATAAAVMAVGAVPIIAEVDDSLTLDPTDLEGRITERTVAVIPVHMRGAPADMDGIMEVARSHRLRVVEDAAQAMGASYHGRRLGTIGDLGAFSLQFNKILTAGEGGLVTTSDRRLYERALMYHDVAASQRTILEPDETFVGVTCRMSELQGAVARVQLDRLEEMLSASRTRSGEVKRAIGELAREKEIEFRRSNDEAGDTGIALVMFAPNARIGGFMAEALRAEGVKAHALYDPAKRDYHVAAHWTPVLSRRSWTRNTPWAKGSSEVTYTPDSWPRTNDLLARSVHVDVSPDLTDTQTEQLVEAVRKVLRAL